MSGRWYKSLGEAGRAWNLPVVEILERAIAGELGLASETMTWPGGFVDIGEVEWYLNRLKDGLEPKFQLCVPVPEFERYSRELNAGKTGWTEGPRKTKRETIEKYQEWQEGINTLAREKEHSGKSHEDLCRILARRTEANWQNIRRHTRKP